MLNTCLAIGVTATPSPTPGASEGQRLKTGQTTCYDTAGAVIGCGGTGQDGELQKGLAPAYADNGDGTITDSQTGLMWEKLSDDGSIHDKDNTYTWSDTFDTKIAALNGAAFAGHDDWRLPNINELQSLANYGVMLPALNNAAFNVGCSPGCTVTTCSCTMLNYYWSSTSNEQNPSNTWNVNSAFGNISQIAKSASGYVRTVRDAAPVARGQRLKTGQTICYDTGGAAIGCAGTGQDGALQKGQAPAYVDNRDGTLTDGRTGLTWEKLSDDGSIHDKDNLYTWTDAFSGKIAALNSARFAGHTDWRLPNINELHSLTNYGAMYPIVHDAAFNADCSQSCTVTTCSCTAPGLYWSSTTIQNTPNYAWIVNFFEGHVAITLKSDVSYVRAVRGGA